MITTNGKMIDEFLNTKDATRIEQLADALGNEFDARSVDPLLLRLGDLPVQEDPDLECAVCDALVRFGVMQKLGNLNYRFLPAENLPPVARVAVYNNYVRLLPRKYF
ncbi:MAG: hypothetical protein JO250_10530 [Armatimonadetes bacterium]|nr:hypothetical protein [Armatimonadota bacterium]